MANFDIPFASTGPRRSPTSDEKANGFPCGAADQTLFNGMFHRLEAEVGGVISYAGLTPTDADYAQLRKAIVLLIAAATGGGETTDYLLISQASSRLPIFPEVMSTDGKINFTAPVTGTVRLPGGVDIMHRGINVVTSVQTDFATIASRTYHIRWNPTDGFELLHTANAIYNPEGLAETDPFFDSTYDDILLARVVTNAGNIATITPLANKAKLFAQGIKTFNPSDTAWQPVGTIDAITSYLTETIDWARTPRAWMSGGLNLTVEVGTGGGEVNMGVRTLSRYQIAPFWQRNSTPGGTHIAWMAEV